MADPKSSKLERIRRLVKDGAIALHHTAIDFTEFERSLAKAGRAVAGSVRGLSGMTDAADAVAKTSPASWHVAFKMHVIEAADHWLRASNPPPLIIPPDPELAILGKVGPEIDKALEGLRDRAMDSFKLPPEHVRCHSSRPIDLGPAIPGPDFFKSEGKPLPEAWEAGPVGIPERIESMDQFVGRFGGMDVLTNRSLPERVVVITDSGLRLPVLIDPTKPYINTRQVPYHFAIGSDGKLIDLTERIANLELKGPSGKHEVFGPEIHGVWVDDIPKEMNKS